MIERYEKLRADEESTHNRRSQVVWFEGQANSLYGMKLWLRGEEE